MRRIGLALVLLVTLRSASRQETSPTLPPATRAQMLHRWAVEAIEESTLQGRQRALREILAAIDLEPLDAEHWLLLGHLRVLGEFDRASRDCFRHAIVLDPRNLTAYLE